MNTGQLLSIGGEAFLNVKHIHASWCFCGSLPIFFIHFSSDQHLMKIYCVPRTELDTLKTKKVMVPFLPELRVKCAYFNQGSFGFK